MNPLIYIDRPLGLPGEFHVSTYVIDEVVVLYLSE